MVEALRRWSTDTWKRLSYSCNIPSGGTQRLVPTILEAVSTAPYSTPATIVAQQAVKGNVLVGGSSAIQVTKLLDGYNNVLDRLLNILLAIVLRVQLGAWRVVTL